MNSRRSTEESERRPCSPGPRTGPGAECGVRTGAVSKAVFLETAIESAAAQAQRFACMAHVAAKTRERFLNQHALHVFNAHFIQLYRGLPRGTQTEIARANLRALRHQHSTLDRMIQL